MPSLNPTYLSRIRLDTAEASAVATLGRYRGRQELFQRQTSEVLLALRQGALIESAESSNRIEGVTASPDRIEAIIANRRRPETRSEQEIAGYRDGLELIHESATEMQFSVNVVLQIHSLLYRYQGGHGGRWKATTNEIIERDASGAVVRVRFRPPEPVATPQLMDDLVTDYARAVDAQHESLVLVPLAILDFLAIHPFSDGNGRTGRLLTLMLLYQAGFDVGRYVSLERIIEESRETYYDALERSSQGWHDDKHDPNPWLRYFWGMLIRAYREFEERVGAIRTGRGAKADLVEAAIARQTGPFSISEIEAESPGVTRDWVRLVLRRLRDDGSIRSTGRGRNARWVKIQKQDG